MEGAFSYERGTPVTHALFSLWQLRVQAAHPRVHAGARDGLRPGKHQVRPLYNSLSLPHPGSPAILNLACVLPYLCRSRVDGQSFLELACWVCGTNSSTLERESARDHQSGGPRLTGTELGLTPAPSIPGHLLFSRRRLTESLTVDRGYSMIRSQRERVFIKLMTSDRKREVSREMPRNEGTTGPQRLDDTRFTA